MAEESQRRCLASGAIWEASGRLEASGGPLNQEVHSLLIKCSQTAATPNSTAEWRGREGSDPVFLSASQGVGKRRHGAAHDEKYKFERRGRSQLASQPAKPARPASQPAQQASSPAATMIKDISL